MKYVQLAMIAMVRLYQLSLSPWFGRECRYIPTCSSYAIEAIRLHGPVKGGWLALKRILRCHPLGGRGYDPVPERFRWLCLCRDCSKDDGVGKDSGNRKFFNL